MSLRALFTYIAVVALVELILHRCCSLQALGTVPCDLYCHRALRLAPVVDSVVLRTLELLGLSENALDARLRLNVDPELLVAPRAQNLAGDVVHFVNYFDGGFCQGFPGFIRHPASSMRGLLH